LRSKTKSRPQRLLLAGIVSLAVLLLLLRLFVFVSGHGHRRFRGAAIDPSAATVHAASYDTPGAGHRLFAQPWTDRFADGTPDFLRLTDPADQAAFRQWFTAIADYQAVRPRADVPTEISDCASLLRYAYREALKRHDDTWFAATGMDVPALPGEIRAWRYPETPLGAACSASGKADLLLPMFPTARSPNSPMRRRWLSAMRTLSAARCARPSQETCSSTASSASRLRGTP